ncbi:hypothetical protein KVT40_000686 [Elsinoe batatas]|uniref:Uncharacterized protein n=1 Tax=Elsinoe batatas TaxID=2601811 RepID=A0A8K0PIV7_9PEZI|nr:hypothetical protein KVT40_000686 [Elsinoe batatas]
MTFTFISFLVLATIFILNPPRHPAGLVALRDQIDQLSWIVNLLDKHITALSADDRPAFEQDVNLAKCKLAELGPSIEQLELHRPAIATFVWPFRSPHLYRQTRKALRIVNRRRNSLTDLGADAVRQLVDISDTLKELRTIPTQTGEVIDRIIAVQRKIEDLTEWVNVERYRSSPSRVASSTGGTFGTRRSTFDHEGYGFDDE